MNAPFTAPSLAAQIANLPKLNMKDLWVVLSLFVSIFFFVSLR